LYHIMDRITLAQYIGVSRASLYRAFEKRKSINSDTKHGSLIKILP